MFLIKQEEWFNINDPCIYIKILEKEQMKKIKINKMKKVKE